jgi:hypothetical protein
MTHTLVSVRKTEATAVEAGVQGLGGHLASFATYGIIWASYNNFSSLFRGKREKII